MTYFKRFSIALFSIALLGIFSSGNSFASLERKDEKVSKKPSSYTLEDYEDKFGKLLVSLKGRIPTSQNFKQYHSWFEKKGLKCNFVMYPIVCNKKRTFFIKKNGILKLDLEKGDKILALLPLGKFTVAAAPKKTVLPLIKDFLTEKGKLTLGDIRD
ncbi:MAG: hypothetical protein GY915_08905 [bacterium]|nr:hypothetical protein [bacterium]